MTTALTTPLSLMRRLPRATHAHRRFAISVGIALVACLSWNATALNLGGDRPETLTSALFNTPRDTEGLLVKSLLEISQGRTQAALATIEHLLEIVPNFKLAHLVRGDLLMARAREISGFGNVPDAPDEIITDFREEARVRVQHYLSQQNARHVPEYLWLLDPNQQHAIVVDTSQSRLYLYRNEGGKPRYVADFYVTVGKNGTEKYREGDKRTPLGIYFAGTQLSQKLPDFYGGAAFPLNYPNEWDRHQGRNGHGIWLHGTPSDTYSRPPRASDGCIVLTNPDLQKLTPILQAGHTPVIITRNMRAFADREASMSKESLLHALETWRRDWEAQDTDRYLSHYASDFFSKDLSLERWTEEKRRIQAAKIRAKITLSNISMFRYPDGPRPMVVVNFDQEYKSRTVDSRMRKRQYWVIENNRWKILYEGAA